MIEKTPKNVEARVYDGTEKGKPNRSLTTEYIARRHRV